MIFPELFGARTVPGTPLDAPGAFLYDPNAESDSGVSVTDSTAIGFSAVWRAVSLLSEAVSTLPMRIVERQGRSRVEVDDHPVSQLIRLEPNVEQAVNVWEAQTVAQRYLHGNAYSFIQRDRAATPLAIWPLDPKDVKARREGEDGTGALFYEHNTNDPRFPKALNPRDVIHFQGLAPNGILGVSPISAGRHAIGLGIALERFGGKFLANYARPSGYLKVPINLKEKEGSRERLKAEWEQFQQSSNLHRVAVLEAGIEWVQLGIAPDEAQYLESRKFQVTEMARLFGVPPHMLMDLERATFDNIEEQEREFLKHSLQPLLIRLEQELTRKLFDRRERMTLAIKHNLDSFLRASTKDRFEAYALAIMNGIMSPNEIRALEDLNPREGGDEYLTPLNMRQGANAPQNQVSARADLAVRTLLEITLARAVRRETKIVGAKFGSSSSESLYQGFEQYLEGQLGEVARVAGQMGVEVDPKRIAERWVGYSMRRLEKIDENGLAAELLEWQGRPGQFANQEDILR